MGHAIGAISIAAAGLGWQARIVDCAGTDHLAYLLGLSLHEGAEQEEPDVLIAIGPLVGEASEMILSEKSIEPFKSLQWQGTPNLLSASHVDWGMNKIALATRKPSLANEHEHLRPNIPLAPPEEIRPLSLHTMIRQRRSAVAMDKVTTMSRAAFYAILQRIATDHEFPFNTLPWKPHIHLAIFVHRVDDLPSGLYFLVRDPLQKKNLQAAFTRIDNWQPAPGCPEHLELSLLVEADVREPAMRIACFQDIAADGCFSVAMIAAFEEPLEQHGPWLYPRLYWEAGLIGQLLYLEAEAAAIRGTGIGCFFDDTMHEILGLTGRTYQDLYHFTVGGPIEDRRLQTLPSYTDESYAPIEPRKTFA